MEFINKSLLSAEISRISDRNSSWKHFFGGKKNTERKVLQTNGVDQYGKLAKPITGVGQGTITIVAKVSDIGVPQYLFDGDSASNRLFCYLDTSGNIIRSAGLTATANGSGSVVAWGSQAIIEVAGDFTGLVLATLLRQYGPVFFTKAQPFCFKYEDTAQTLEFNFDSGLGYDLPVGAVVGRDLVTQNATMVWDGTEADFTAVSLGLGDLSNRSFAYKVIVAGSTQGKVKLNGAIDDSPWFIGDGNYEGVIVNPGAYLTLQTHAGDNRLIGTVTVSIREVPNALIWQNNPTWADYVQQPNGDWLLKGSDPAEYIVLSDYQRNQFYIAQAEKAIAGYQAKQNSRWVTKADGVDDHITHAPISLAGAFKRGVTFTTSVAGNYQRLFSSTDGAIRAYIEVDGKLTLRVTDGTNINYVTTAQIVPMEVNQGTTHRLIIERDDTDTFSGTLDGQPLSAHKQMVLGTIVFDDMGVSYFGSNLWQGQCWDNWIIDHTAPLPIGQGGNSGYWPLNDPDNTVRNVLGKDAKGNVVAKDGAGEGVNLYTVGELVLSDNTAQGYTNLGSQKLVKIIKPATVQVSENGSWKGLGLTELYITTQNINFRANEAAPVVCTPQVVEAYGYGTWQGNPTRELYTLDKVDGSLLGPNIATLATKSSGYYPIDNGDGSFKVGDRDPAWQSYLSWVAALETGATYRVGYTPEGPNNSDGLVTVGGWGAQLRASEMGAAAQADITSIGTVLQFRPYDGVTTAYVNMRDFYAMKKLSLSPELQRQYDLAQVEAKISKLDKLYSKVVPLLTLDGVDDGATGSKHSIAGNFKISVRATLSTTGGYLLGEEGGTSDRIAIWNGNLYVTINGIATNDTSSPYAPYAGDGVLHWFHFERSGGDLICSVDAEEPIVTVSNSGIFEYHHTGHKGSQVSSIPNWQGKLGPIPMIDYANPLNSRYYVATATGLVDMLATVGDETAGEAFINSTEGYVPEANAIVETANGQLKVTRAATGSASAVKSYTVNPNIPVLVTWDATGPVSGARVHLGSESVWNAYGGDHTKGWVLITPTTATLRVFAYSGSSVGDASYYSNISIKEYPNAGTYQGNPTLPHTFMKVGGDLYGPAQTIVPNNIGAQWASVGAGMYALTGDGNYSSLQSTDMLVVGKEYEVSLTVEAISGYTLKVQDGPVDLIFPNAPGVYITRFVATTTVLNMARRHPGETINATLSNLTLKQIIKGA